MLGATGPGPHLAEESGATADVQQSVATEGEGGVTGSRRGLRGEAEEGVCDEGDPERVHGVERGHHLPSLSPPFHTTELGGFLASHCGAVCSVCTNGIPVYTQVRAALRAGGLYPPGELLPP